MNQSSILPPPGTTPPPDHPIPGAVGSSHLRFANSYVLLILAAMLCTYLYSIRAQSVFACPATGYDSDNYLAYCHADHYGDYDHGALWFDLEPGVRPSINAAQVLFLGNSHMQFAFSTDEINRWFSSNAIRFYLMGFAYWENHLFEGALLRRFEPTAKVYVINIDNFFDQRETPPAGVVMRGSDAHSRYQRKREWQRYHSNICGRLPVFCGNDQSFFRSRSTGEYTLKGGRVGQFPVSYNMASDPKMVREYSEVAKRFVAGLPVSRQCVIFTMVPTVGTQVGTAQSVAAAVGVALIAPRLDGLNTFDKSHMDRAGAEQWSKAFLSAAAAPISRCVAGARGAVL
jgi:hypothetical protein